MNVNITIKIHYVGNPTVEEVTVFKSQYVETQPTFVAVMACKITNLLLLFWLGVESKKLKTTYLQCSKLPSRFEDYQMVIAGAPSIENFLL